MKRTRLVSFIVALVFFSGLAFAQEESITFTTYYPSPYGSYNQLQTNSFGVGDNNGNGVLDANDSPPTTTPPYGDVWIAGKVGIGTTTPARTLEVAGTNGMRLKPSALPLTPAAGDIAVDSGDSNKLKWYDGTIWKPMGGGFPAPDWDSGWLTYTADPTGVRSLDHKLNLTDTDKVLVDIQTKLSDTSWSYAPWANVATNALINKDSGIYGLAWGNITANNIEIRRNGTGGCHVSHYRVRIWKYN